MTSTPYNLIVAGFVIVLVANRCVTAIKIFERRRKFQNRTFILYFSSTIFIALVLGVVVILMANGWYVAGALTSCLCGAAMLVRDMLLGKEGRKDLDANWVK
jgi:hypothetical protein